MVQSLPEKPLVALQAVLQEMREQTDSRVLIDLTLGYIRHVFVAPLLWLAIYDYENHQLLGQGGVTLLEDISLLTSVHPLHPGEIMEQVVIEQRPISLPDMSQEPRMGIWQREAKRLGGIQGCLLHPVRHQNRCLGVLMLGSQVWGVTTTDEEKALLGILLGQLAASLIQLESTWKQQMEKHLDDPLINLARTLRDLTSLDERVEVVTSLLQDFVGIGRIVTYWFDRKEYHFAPHKGAGAVVTPPVKPVSALPQHGSGAQAKASPAGPAPTFFTTRDLGDMYYTLADGQVVCATEEAGSIRSEVTPKLMQQMRVKALMAAPILLEGDLLGFINAESDTPRVWSDVDRQMIAAAANMLALTVPLDQLDVTTRRVDGHRALLDQIAEATYSQMDLQQAIPQAITALVERLQVSACVALLYRPASQTFSLLAEHRREGRIPLPKQFGPLSEQDWNDLKRQEGIAAENYAQDLRLISWRPELDPVGVKALMMAHTSPEGTTDDNIEGVLLVAHLHRRSWTREERQLLRAMAQQLGLMMRQSRMEQTLQRQDLLFNGLINATTGLQSLQTLEDIYNLTAELTSQLLAAPLVTIVSWLPGEAEAQVQTIFTTAADFKITPTEPINPYTDPLIAQCLQSETGLLESPVEELSKPTRTWLNAPGLGRILATPLGVQDGITPPIGILVIGDQQAKAWEPEEQVALTLLGHTCGWSLRRILWTQTLQVRAESLRELNWYKHRRLVDFQTSLLDSLRRLGQVSESTKDESQRWQKVVEIARGLRDLTLPTQSILRSEAWEVHPEQTSFPIASLIRRTLRRADTLVQKRKLWPRVHGETGYAVMGDPGRLEMVIYEVLVAAVLRSQQEERLDLWLREEESGFLELLMVDQGEMDPHLVAALQVDPEYAIYTDPLEKNLLSVSPGLELSLCQRVIHRMGGQLSFFQAEDGRNVSRLLLPMAVEGMDPVMVGEEGEPQ
jgi:GAF domain-containing protein